MTKKRSSKLEKLKAAGWKETSVEEFLNLSPEEVEWIKTREALIGTLKRLRSEANLSQTELAKQLKSSQSRIAKMEAGDATVSTDLLLKAIYKLGGTNLEVARTLRKYEQYLSNVANEKKKVKATVEGPSTNKKSLQRVAVRR